MKKTFVAEIKHIFKNKWRIITFILMLFTPFIYGFLYMNAFWSPFQHVSNLKIGIVDRNQTDMSNKLTNTIVKNNITIANQIYKLKKVKDNKNSKNLVDSGEYAAILEIPKEFKKGIESISNVFQENIGIIYKTIEKPIQEKYKSIKEIIEDKKFPETNSWKIGFKPNSKISTNYIMNEFKKNAKGKLLFYNSFKHNYLKGEITNFLGESLDLYFNIISNPLYFYTNKIIDKIDKITGISKKDIKKIKDEFHKVIKSFIPNKNDINKLLDLRRTTSKLVNTYGFGLSPYFISIALWAGSLTMGLIIKNKRYIKTEGTLKHYFGKWLVWIFAGIIQSLILLISITLQGVNLGWKYQWELFLFVIFCSIIFVSIVQAVSYSFRYSDLGEFAIIILLIIQLISCSGTFPVEMQNIVFRIISPVIPFTYVIEIIREIFWEPNILLILKNIIILFVFPTFIIPISLLINWRFDKKNLSLNNNIKTYKSFEIHLGDY